MMVYEWRRFRRRKEMTELVCYKHILYEKKSHRCWNILPCRLYYTYTQHRILSIETFIRTIPYCTCEKCEKKINLPNDDYDFVAYLILTKVSNILCR